MLVEMMLSVALTGPTVSLEEAVDQLGLQSGPQQVQLQVRVDGQSHDLVFERVDVLEPGVVPVVGSRLGERPADLGGLTMWRAADAQGASCFVGISKWGVAGFFKSTHGLHSISSGPWGTTKGPVTASRPDERGPSLFERPGCAVRTLPGWQPPIPTRGGGEGQPCRVASLAIDTDWEYTERIFLGDPDAGAAYALTLAAAISEIFTTELNVRMAVSFLRTWSEDVDPYDPDSSVDMLDQFRTHWTTSMTDVDRTVAHMLTGRTNLPYGGVAWLGVLCNQSYGFGVSGYLEGTFPYPLQHNHGGNWDLLVTCHELGHNFGTLHTHDGFSPPLDNCGNDDCTGAENGTIMSYCHICEGGVSNIELGFHPEVRATILGYMDAVADNCNLDAGAATALDDDTWTIINIPVDVDVLANDAAATCDDVDIDIDTFDSESVEGGVITLVPDGPAGRPLLNYAPPVDWIGIDSFGYGLPSGTSATVTVDVIDLRAGDEHGPLAPGLQVAYYVLSAPSQLPDFDQLEPYLTGTVAQINFVSTDGVFAGSGRSDDVGAVFEAFLDVPQDGLYTLYTESDDGSRLYIGDLLVVDNDGLHGMEERSGLIGLEAGQHRIRVEFFENAETAGLITRWAGPGLAKQIIPAAQWGWEDGTSSCPEDVDGSGTIDVNDLLAVISAFGPCDGCPEDMDGDGIVGVDEILAVLSLYGDDC